MGAKGLKAIVIEPSKKSRAVIADPDAFKDAARIFARAVKEHPMTGEMLPALGTPALVGIVNAMGAFPSRNATIGTMAGWEKISGEALAEQNAGRGGNNTHMGCSQCIIRCSNEVVDAKGKFITSSLEYETIWSMGGMTGIDDLDTIARLDFLCDDIGLDTMNTGVAISVAMDAGKLDFGDGPGAIDLLEQIGQGTPLGMVVGNGPDAVGKHFGHPRVPTVKGQSIAAYDPRAYQGQGVTYSTSPMGADHTAGNMIGEYLSQALDPLKPDGQVEGSRNTQIGVAALDCTGLCLFAGAALDNAAAGEALLNLINAKLGTQMGPEAIPALGIRVLKQELAFNQGAGFSSKDDRLPQFFYTEPLPPHNKVFLIPDEELDRTFNI
jgi:aldehyde:ferredoxin oxidoreductase